MGDSPDSAAQAASSHGSESSGFKSFWKKSDRTSESQNVKFIQQDPSNKKNRSRLSRIFKPGSTPSSQDDGDDAGASTAQKRRQQVYQAQKRHRNRKQEYVQTLEAEIARLQHLDALVNSEKNTLAHQNNTMKQLLSSHSLDAQFESFDISSSSQPSDELSQLGGTAVDIRFDETIGHERVFLDSTDDMVWTSDETSTEGQPQKPERHTPVPGDSWAALDFILALEWPCQNHVKHHGINPKAETPEACSVGKFHGHALVTTAAVFQSALPPPQASEADTQTAVTHGEHGLDHGSSGKWQLPHSEIDKLVQLSQALELDDESMTPAQAYSAIREAVPSEKYLRPALEALKIPLSSLVQCHGFGALMDAAMYVDSMLRGAGILIMSRFWQHFDGALQSLKFTRPELLGQ